jgi:hypothetical protein
MHFNIFREMEFSNTDKAVTQTLVSLYRIKYRPGYIDPTPDLGILSSLCIVRHGVHPPATGPISELIFRKLLPFLIQPEPTSPTSCISGESLSLRRYEQGQGLHKLYPLDWYGKSRKI